MLLLLRLVLWLVFLSPFAAALLVWLALSDTPLVAEQPPLSHEDISRAKTIVEQHKAQQENSQPLYLALSERDLELAGTYLLRRLTDASLTIAIQDDQLHAGATLWVPGFPSRPYLNIELGLRDQAGEPNLVHLQINRLAMPRDLAKWILNRALTGLYRTEEYRLARSIVDELRLHRKQLHLYYRWTPEIEQRARATFLKQPQSTRQVYRAELQRLLEEDPSTNPALTEILRQLFELARQRSADGDPVAENRALLTVLGYWATTHRTLATELLGRDSGPPLRFRARLNQRRDQARHFLISAALASSINDTAASMAGILKELTDAEQGSGFSFIDLTADRAGTRFGELAVASAGLARRLQDTVAGGVEEADFIPGIEQLSEGLDLEEFRGRYGNLDSPEYRDILDHIDNLIDHCRLYQELEVHREGDSINS